MIDFELGQELQLASSCSALALAEHAGGTPRSATPEQIAGEALSPVSVVLSWALVLFETVTRRLPVGADLPSEFAPADLPRSLDLVFTLLFPQS